MNVLFKHTDGSDLAHAIQCHTLNKKIYKTEYFGNGLNVPSFLRTFNFLQRSKNKLYLLYYRLKYHSSSLHCICKLDWTNRRVKSSHETKRKRPFSPSFSSFIKLPFLSPLLLTSIVILGLPPDVFLIISIGVIIRIYKRFPQLFKVKGTYNLCSLALPTTRYQIKDWNERIARGFDWIFLH